MELIHVSCFIKEAPIGTKDDLIILHAEAWRDENTKKAYPVRISLNTDLYLDCLAEAQGIEDEVYLHFCVEDSWKALKKVFKQPNFAFYLEDDFQLSAETEDDLILLKEF